MSAPRGCRTADAPGRIASAVMPDPKSVRDCQTAPIECFPPGRQAMAFAMLADCKEPTSKQPPTDRPREQASHRCLQARRQCRSRSRPTASDFARIVSALDFDVYGGARSESTSFDREETRACSCCETFLCRCVFFAFVAAVLLSLPCYCRCRGSVFPVLLAEEFIRPKSVTGFLRIALQSLSLGKSSPPVSTTTVIVIE